MRKTIILFIAVLLIAICFTSACKGADDNTKEYKDTSVIEEKNEIMEIYLYIGQKRLTVSLEDNPSTVALTELLLQGDITYVADDYGGFEKVGDVGHSLPRSDRQITTKPGDVILYQGRSICLYYGQNSWNFTKIGSINGYEKDELKGVLLAGQGKINVRISLK